MARRLRAWAVWHMRIESEALQSIRWVGEVAAWSEQGRTAAARMLREDPPVKRWSATILIETDDDDAAIAAGIAARAGAQQAVAGVGVVLVSDLMRETPSA